MPSELIAPFLAARRLLEAADDAPLVEIKRSYRRAVAAHPPDRDPEQFGRIRAAFELLSEPLAPATERLVAPHPYHPPPVFPPPPARGALFLAVLRHAVAQLPSDALVVTSEPAGTKRDHE